MRTGKEFIGKPIYSLTEGRLLGTVKDVYLDLELSILNGIYLGSEGLINRRVKAIERKNISVFGLDAVLVTESDVLTDNNKTPEIEVWLRREDVQGRGIETPGGTKVGTIGDLLFDEEARVIGFSLARVFVEGPVAEKRVILKEAVLNPGGKDGVVTVDLARAEQHEAKPATSAPSVTESEPIQAVETPVGEPEAAPEAEGTPDQ